MLLMRWLLAPPRLWVRDETAATLLTQACNPRRGYPSCGPIGASLQPHVPRCSTRPSMGSTRLRAARCVASLLRGSMAPSGRAAP